MSNDTSPVMAYLAAGHSGVEAARHFGVSKARISQIRLGRGSTAHPLWTCVCGEADGPGRAIRSAHHRSRSHTEYMLWSRVDRSGPIPTFAPHLGECWIWTGNLGGGSRYGYAAFGCRTEFAHRISFEIANGPIPTGLTIDHLCRVNLCVRPSHLEAVTRAENTRRGINGVLRHLRQPRQRKAVA